MENREKIIKSRVRETPNSVENYNMRTAEQKDVRRPIPISLEIHIPENIPSRSMTAICASPFAVMSPILSDVRENDLYIAFLVEDDVNIAICFNALATAAVIKKSDGKK